MIIFIDESGIHKRTEHSSFVLVYIEVEDAGEIEQRILETESRLHIEPFHWNQQRWKVKEPFLSEASKLRFKMKVAIYKNPVDLPADFERILTFLIIERKINKIIIEGNKPKWYELKIKKVLRDKGVSVKKLRTARDESFAGLRLADALAGLIRAYYDDPEKVDNKKFYDMFRKKITAQLVGGQVTR